MCFDNVKICNEYMFYIELIIKHLRYLIMSSNLLLVI